MAKATKVKTDATVKSAKFIEQELAGENLQQEVVPNFDIAESIHEEESTLDRRKDEGVRKLKISNDLLQAQVDKLNNDNRARKTHSTLIFLMVFTWILFVVVFLILVGAETLKISDKVLITLLSTTSVNIIGLLIIVANYLFNKSKST